MHLKSILIYGHVSRPLVPWGAFYTGLILQGNWGELFCSVAPVSTLPTKRRRGSKLQSTSFTFYSLCHILRSSVFLYISLISLLFFRGIHLPSSWLLLHQRVRSNLAFCENRIKVKSGIEPCTHQEVMWMLIDIEFSQIYAEYLYDIEYITYLPIPVPAQR